MDLDKLMNKHLTRYFDGSKTIPEETLQQLLRFLRSTPSSTNVQPNHFYVLATEAGKKQLATNLGERFQDNAEKVMNASHVVILTTRTDVPDEHLDAVFAKERADKPVPRPGEAGAVGVDDPRLPQHSRLRLQGSGPLDGEADLHGVGHDDDGGRRARRRRHTAGGVRSGQRRRGVRHQRDRVHGPRCSWRSATPTRPRSTPRRSRGSTPTGCSPSPEPWTRRLQGAGSTRIGVRPHAPAPPARERRVHQHEHPGG